MSSRNKIIMREKIVLILALTMVLLDASKGEIPVEKDNLSLKYYSSLVKIPSYVKDKRFIENPTETEKDLLNIEKQNHDYVHLNPLQDYFRKLDWTNSERAEELRNRKGVPKVKRIHRIQRRAACEEKYEEEECEEEVDENEESCDEEDDDHEYDNLLRNSWEEYIREIKQWAGVAEESSVRAEKFHIRQGVPKVKRIHRIQRRAACKEKNEEKECEDEDDEKDDEEGENEDSSDEEDDEEPKYIYIPVRANWKIRSKTKLNKKEGQSPAQANELSDDSQQGDPQSNCDQSQKNGPAYVHRQVPCMQGEGG